MKKQWKRLAALSSAVVMAAGTLLYFPTDTAKYLVGDHGECGGNRHSDMDRNRR